MITEEECLKIGGHCWEIQNEILLSCPPQSIRICKHCGKKQIGSQQPSTIWR